MQPATALHRHQSSLEGIIDFSKKPPLSLSEYQSASRRFYQLIGHFESLSHNRRGENKYDRVKLVRLTFEYARSKESQGNFLRAFFEAVDISIDKNDDIDLSDADRRAGLQESVHNFADYLFENFFLPRMYPLGFAFFLAPCLNGRKYKKNSKIFPTSRAFGTFVNPPFSFFSFCSESLYRENPTAFPRIPFGCPKGPRRGRARFSWNARTPLYAPESLLIP